MWNVVLHSFEEPPHLSVLTTFYRCSTLYVWIVFTNSKPIKKMWLKWNWFLWSMSTFTIPTNTSIFTDQVSLKNAIGQTLIEAANAFSTKGWNKLHDFAQIFSLDKVTLVAESWSQSAELSWQILTKSQRMMVTDFFSFKVWFHSIQSEDIEHVWYFKPKLDSSFVSKKQGMCLFVSLFYS